MKLTKEHLLKLIKEEIQNNINLSKDLQYIHDTMADYTIGRVRNTDVYQAIDSFANNNPEFQEECLKLKGLYQNFISGSIDTTTLLQGEQNIFREILSKPAF